jgi:hypothetical protein
MSIKRLWLGGMFLFLMGISACEGDPSDGEPDGGDPADGSTGDETAHGTFLLSLVAPLATNPGFTAVLGKVYDGPFPYGVIWEDHTGSGLCRLYVPRIPFCDPPCMMSEEVCVEDDSCARYPTPIGVGTVQVEGMVASFSMDPLNSVYQITGVTLPYPPFSEGDDITFAASGDSSVAAFTMTAKGISPLTVLNETILVDGSPLTLQWVPPNNPALSTISVMFDVSYHGGTKGKVEFEAPDTGSVVVPGELLDQLINLGTSGFPKVEITRRATGITTPPVPVTLIVQSRVTRFLSIPGVISCMGDSDCPEGMTCGNDFKCY